MARRRYAFKCLRPSHRVRNSDIGCIVGLFALPFLPLLLLVDGLSKTSNQDTNTSNAAGGKFGIIIASFCAIFLIGSLFYTTANYEPQSISNYVDLQSNEKYALIAEHQNFQQSGDRLTYLKHTELMMVDCIGCRKKLNVWRKKWKTPQELKQISKDQANEDMERYSDFTKDLNKGRYIGGHFDDLIKISPKFKYYSTVKKYIPIAREQLREAYKMSGGWEGDLKLKYDW